MVQNVKLVILKYVIAYFLLAHTSVAFGCKCESSSLAECCRSSNFTALFSDSVNVAYLNVLPKPFHIVTPNYIRKKQQIQISTSEIKINVSAATNATSRGGCVTASSCAVKMLGDVNGKVQRKNTPCEVVFCDQNSTYNASIRVDSKQVILTKLRCVNAVCGHVFVLSGAQASISGSPTPRGSAMGTTNDSLGEEEDTDMDGSATGIGVTVVPRGKAEGTTAGEAAVLDTVWLVVILGGVALGVLVVVGIVFACFARRDRRRKAAPRRVGGLHSGSLPSPTSWSFRRTSAGSASVPLAHTGTLPTPTLSGNPRFNAAVNEFYRAALTPDDDDDAASVSDDSMTDTELFGAGRHASMSARRHRRSVPREDALEDEGEEFERSSAQRTIKFSAAPTFVPSSRASSTSTHRVLVEALVEPRPPSAGLSLSGSMSRAGSTNRGPNSTPLPVRSILKKGGTKRSADVAVGTTQCTTPSQLPLADDTAAPRRHGSGSSSASTSSGYSLVECEDKAVGVTEAELDALPTMPLTVGILGSTVAPPPLPVQVPFGGLFVTSAGQLVTRDGQLINAGAQFVSTTGQLVTLAAPLLAPPTPHAAMQTSSHTAHSHSPSTNLSPVSVGSAAPSVPDAGLVAPTPQAARRAALSPHKISADCESASVADSSECDCLSQSAASGTASQNNDDRPSKLAACDAALDREIDAVSLSDLDLFNLARNFDTNLLGLGTAGPFFAPKLTGVGVGLGAARLNRLSSLASDSNNPSALNTPSPPTVAASSIGQPKLELRDTSLELNLNLNIAPASLRPSKAQTLLPTFSRSRLESSVPRGGQSRVETDLDSEADCADIDAVGVAMQHASGGAPVWASTASANVNANGQSSLWQGRQSWTKGAPDQFDFS